MTNISPGDKRYYYLSTQKNDLGVVGAKCAISGQQMVAASWETMQCPKSGVVEQRKVAKISQ
jgi:exosome complex component CSL4